MKALLCLESGPLEGLALEEVASPVAGNGQVVVAVKAAGVNFPDTLIVQGKYQRRAAVAHRSFVATRHPFATRRIVKVPTRSSTRFAKLTSRPTSALA